MAVPDCEIAFQHFWLKRLKPLHSFFRQVACGIDEHTALLPWVHYYRVANVFFNIPPKLYGLLGPGIIVASTGMNEYLPNGFFKWYTLDVSFPLSPEYLRYGFEFGSRAFITSNASIMDKIGIKNQLYIGRPDVCCITYHDCLWCQAKCTAWLHLNLQLLADMTPIHPGIVQNPICFWT